MGGWSTRPIVSVSDTEGPHNVDGDLNLTFVTSHFCSIISCPEFSSPYSINW